MKRQGIVAVVAIVALVVAVVLLARRGSGGGGDSAPSAAATSARFYASDSLGFRIRIPDSPGWTLRVDPPGQQDGGVVSAAHSDEQAIVRVFTHPAAPGETLDDVFAARKGVLANLFGLDNLDLAIAKVMHDEQREVGGRQFRQYQAITQASATPEGESIAVVFMWMQTIDADRALECIGIVRTPVPATPEQQQTTDGLLRDVAYVLQSFEVR